MSSKRVFIPAYLTIIALLFIISPIAANAESEYDSWAILAGYRYIDVDFQYTHDTHEDDTYLYNSQVAGSAGTTEINGSNWFFIGGRYQIPLSERVSSNVDAGMLFGGDEEKTKNKNDIIKEDNLMIYSRSSVGALMGVTVNYQATAKISCGIEGQVTGAFVESGYYRWGSYDERSKDWEIFPSIGPKASYKIDENFMLESSYHFAKNKQAALTLSYTF